MDLESIYCIDSDFDGLEMGGFVGIDRLVPRARETARFGEDDCAVWGADHRDPDRAFGRRTR